FRCIRRATIELGPLTVLVGPNASGKTSLLQALDPRLAAGAMDRWRHQADALIQVAVDGFGVSGDLKREAGWSVPRIDYRYQHLRLDLGRMRRANVLTREEKLLDDGGNLTNVFATLTRSQQIALAAEICRLAPVYADVDYQPLPGGGGEVQLRFQDKWRSDVWYS